MLAKSNAYLEVVQLNEITSTMTAQSTEDREYYSTGRRKVP